MIVLISNLPRLQNYAQLSGKDHCKNREVSSCSKAERGYSSNSALGQRLDSIINTPSRCPRILLLDCAHMRRKRLLPSLNHLHRLRVSSIDALPPVCLLLFINYNQYRCILHNLPCVIYPFLANAPFVDCQAVLHF